jgi:soluble lytic murein transglycosylase
MELVPYAESREYGKKVLANYYIYRKILGRPFRLTHYFQNLARPHHHDGGQSAKKAVSR